MMVALTLLCASLAACAGATKPNQQQTVSQPTAEAQPEDNAGNVGINSPDSGRAVLPRFGTVKKPLFSEIQTIFYALRQDHKTDSDF